MSYILDALRRAESERERGAVPTLHTTAAPAGAADAEGGRPRWRPWAWGGVAALLLVLGGLASQWLSGERAVVVAVAPSPVPAPVPAPPVPAPKPSPATVQIDPDAISLPPPPLVRAPTPAPAAAATVPDASQLPEALRRELPALTIGGAMYSDTPANRMLIINGQVFHEGDKVAANLVLEQIKLKGAVLSFKGQRYAVNY